MKKKILIIGIIIILFVLLVPIPRHLKDGGTIEFKALTYKIAKVHRLNDNSENGYDEGIRIEILGKEIFSNVSIEKEENEEKEQEVQKYSAVIEDLKLELDIPNNWNYKEEDLKKDSTYLFALNLYKDEDKRNATLYFFKNAFYVCGTGRTTKELILNNNDIVTIGYYGVNESWNHITFSDVYPEIAIINNGLLDDEAAEVLEFIKTLKIKNLEDVILENFNKINEVSEETSSNPYDYIKNDYYKNIVDLGANAVSALEKMYNNGKLTGLNAYLSALAIHDITKCNLYDEYELDWSTAEEFYALWKNNNCSFKN